ncbi:MAG: PTS sugar transporter subunit IIA [Propioniciclava sp.]
MDARDFRARPVVCQVGLEAASAEEVLTTLAANALAAGLVKPTFGEALVTREGKHPTGLPTATPVAIPHADAEHVLAAGVGVATLSRPVSFGVMGGAGAQIEVGIVCMLLVPEPHQQVAVLSRLVEVFQRPGWETPLRLAESPDELAAAFNIALGSSS